jgi:hypothetical protein
MARWFKLIPALTALALTITLLLLAGDEEFYF